MIDFTAGPFGLKEAEMNREEGFEAIRKMAETGLFVREEVVRAETKVGILRLATDVLGLRSPLQSVLDHATSADELVRKLRSYVREEAEIDRRRQNTETDPH
jgi:hypothetical protein